MLEPAPELLHGAWRRSSIVNEDGSTDATSIVLWLQLESEMVDVRLASDLSELTDRRSLNGCTVEDMHRLTTSEASTGRTRCTDIAVGTDGVRRATAEWITRQRGDIAFHPLTSYPELGQLEWSEDGSVMIERAPSGAYVEEWHRLPGSTNPLELLALTDERRLYLAGDVAVLVRDRPIALPRPERIDVLAAEVNDDTAALAQLVDCEFSIAERAGDQFAIIASTLPWRIGEEFDVAP